MNPFEPAVKEATKHIQNQITPHDLSSKNNPNLYAVVEYLVAIANYDWPQMLFSRLLPTLDNDMSYEELLNNLAKIENIHVKIEQINSEAAESFFELSTALPMARKEPNHKLLHDFARSPNLLSAFTHHEDITQYSELISTLGTKEADLLQAALSCEMAGLSKPAEILKREFTERMFLYGNHFYVYLMIGLGDILGRKSSVKLAGKIGNDSRHAINRRVKEAAIELYKQGTYQNPRHAAKSLLPKVSAISKEMGSSLEWEINGFNRLYDWLRSPKI